LSHDFDVNAGPGCTSVVLMNISIYRFSSVLDPSHSIGFEIISI